MMFTIKYRYFTLSPKQSSDVPTCYDQNESLHGPFNTVSQFRDHHNNLVVHGSVELDPCSPMTFGPVAELDETSTTTAVPRPIVWVMNNSGATVARYDL